MDYSAHWAINAVPGLIILILIYDIICQFYIHLFTRFERGSHLMMPPNITLLFAIGQFYVHGHQGQCFPRFSLNFVQGVGIQDGETMEPLWAPLNKIADSTRGMGTASRQECIDDHMNDSNWGKLTRMCGYAAFVQHRYLTRAFLGKSLSRRWKRVCTEWQPAQDAYNDLSTASGGYNVARWKAEAEAAHARRATDPTAMDIYDVQQIKCVG